MADLSLKEHEQLTELLSQIPHKVCRATLGIINSQRKLERFVDDKCFIEKQNLSEVYLVDTLLNFEAEKIMASSYIC